MIANRPSPPSRLDLTPRAAALLTAIPLAATLLRFPHHRYNFYPRCPVFIHLHFQCPGRTQTKSHIKIICILRIITVRFIIFRNLPI